MEKNTFLEFNCEQEEAGQRLDQFLFKKVSQYKNIEIYSRTRIKSLIKEGNLLINGNKVTNPAVKTKILSKYLLQIPSNKEAKPKAENIPLDILFEDNDIIVINKPFGMVVHPGAGNKNNTLVNALLNHCGDTLSGIGGIIRPGIVHRIDKDTSGILVSAKNDFSHIFLSQQFKKHSIVRSYLALVWGCPANNKGVISAPIARDPYHRIKMSVKHNGRPSITKWEIIKSFDKLATLIRCDLETGRTHQIRVHLSSIGHQVVGDKIYTSQKKNTFPIDKNKYNLLKVFPRQALHSYRLGFFHPTTKKNVHFEIPLADDIQNLIQELETY